MPLDFDPLAPAYDAWFEGEGKLIFAIEARAIRCLLPLLPRPWLEVGVGSGRFAEALGIETSVDPSINLLTMARRRGVYGFLGRGEQMPFAAGTFGTAFLVVTLCFVDSPPAVLGETRRVLRPNGKVVLGLVLRESPWGQFYIQKKQEGHRFYSHADFLSFDEVVDLLHRAGFEVDGVVSSLFQRPGEVQDMEEPRDGLSGDAGFTIVVGRKLE